MTSIQLDSGGGAGGGGGGGATNLGYTPSAANGIVTSSTGTSATIPAVDATNAGLMTPAQRAALIAAAGTNLSYTASPTQGTVVSDTGTDATVPAVDATNAGLMLPAQKAAIDALATTYQPLDADLTALAAIAGVQGDVIYHNGTAWTRLAAGTSGQFLKTQGAGANPVWDAAGGGGGSGTVGAGRKAPSASSSYHPAETVPDGAQGSALIPVQRTWWLPCFVDRDSTVVNLATYCWTGEAGAYLRLGIYNASADIVPTTLITDCGNLSGATAGSKDLAVSVAVPAGWFFICVWAPNFSTVRWNRVNAFMSKGPFGSDVTGGIKPFYGRQTATDYSAGLPASASYEFTFATTESVMGNTPNIQYRVTSP